MIRSFRAIHAPAASILAGLLSLAPAFAAQTDAPAFAPTRIFFPVTVTNPLDQPRPSETVELDWNALKAKFPSLAPHAVRVLDASGKELVSQPIDENGDNKLDKLLFQADLAPGAATFRVETARPTVGLAEASPVHAQFIPQRYDDMAWENDKVAFRTYGPEVTKVEGLVSSGIDVWVKRVPYPIINRWYYTGINYHADTGEGADFFSVGPTLGGGGSAIWTGDTFKASANFTDWVIRANGPIRTRFELSFDPIELDGGNKVTEHRIYSLDAGHRMTRMEVTFTYDKAPENPMFVAGLVEREGVKKSDMTIMAKRPYTNWISMWGPIGKEGDGELGTAVVPGRDMRADMLDQDKHLLLRTPIKSGEPSVYWSGAAWSKAGEITSADQWHQYLDAWSARVAAPVKVEF